MVGLSISFIEEGTIEARVVMALQIQNDNINTKQHNAPPVYWPYFVFRFFIFIAQNKEASVLVYGNGIQYNMIHPYCYMKLR